MTVPKVLHQFLAGATVGDAITAHAFTMREWLHQMGITSNLYAEHIHESVAKEVRPYTTYRRSRQEEAIVYHHSLGSEVVDFLVAQAVPLILIHHNVTPPEFFDKVNPGWAQLARWGQEQLAQLRPHTMLALADSAFNELDLVQHGYANHGVLPIIFEAEQYEVNLNETLAAKMAALGPKLLFIGRFSPNKKQEDLVRLLYYYQRIESTAQLILVGDPWVLGYDKWVQWLADNLGLAESVHMPGKVSQQDMVTYYKTADLYVSMSEHEGFGKPLIESMYFNLPILAYSSSSIPYTLNKTGVLFHEKDYDKLAELVDILVKNRPLRQRLLAQQRQRVNDFLEPQVYQQFKAYLVALFGEG